MLLEGCCLCCTLPRVYVHIYSLRVQITCRVIARYCASKWLLSFMSRSSRYFNGVEFVFLWFSSGVRTAGAASLRVWRLTCKYDSFAYKNFLTEVIFLFKCYTT